MNPIIIALFHAPVGLNVLNGGTILALMSVPIIVSIGEDALKAVPDSYREASLALGATRWQTIYRVLLPAAKNVIRVRAIPEVLDDGHTLPPMGLVELVNLTVELFPEGIKRAFVAAQKADWCAHRRYGRRKPASRDRHRDELR